MSDDDTVVRSHHSRKKNHKKRSSNVNRAVSVPPQFDDSLDGPVGAHDKNEEDDAPPSYTSSVSITVTTDSSSNTVTTDTKNTSAKGSPKLPRPQSMMITQAQQAELEGNIAEQALTPNSSSSGLRGTLRLQGTFKSLKRKFARPSLSNLVGEDSFFQPLANPTYDKSLTDLIWFKYSLVPLAGTSSQSLTSSAGLYGTDSDLGLWNFVPAVYMHFHDQEQPSRKAWFTILYCLDDNEDLGTSKQEWLSVLCSTLEVDVFAVDYTGYGLHRGVPSEAAMCRDVCAAYLYLTQECEIPPSRIVLCGKGLGSAPVCFLAHRLSFANPLMPIADVKPSSYDESNAMCPRQSQSSTKRGDNKEGEQTAAALGPASATEKRHSEVEKVVTNACAGLVLICPRIRGTGDARTSRFGESLCDNAKRAPKIAYPVLVVHPTDHLLVPVGAAKRFSSLFKHLHKFVTVTGADLTTVLDMCDEYLDEIASFLQTISNNEYVIKTIRKVPAHIAESPAVAITTWFTVRGLSEYAEQMLAFGFYDLAALKTATQDDFESVGIDDPNTRSLLIAAFAQAETLFEEHPNLFVCTGRKIERGAVTWSVASFDNPKSLPDVVSMMTLSYSVETTRTKSIIRAIAAYEDYERRKATEAAAAAAAAAATTTTTTTTTTKSSSGSSSKRHSSKDRSDSSSSTKDDSGFVKPLSIPKPSVPSSLSPRRDHRTVISPRRISRTVTDRNLAATEGPETADGFGGERAGPSRHHHHGRHRDGRHGGHVGHGGTSRIVQSPRHSKAADERFMSLRDSKGHGAASISVISPPPRKSVAPPEKERKSSIESRQSLAVATKKRIEESESSDESSDTDENGTLEAFLMTVLKKSSTHSNTVRGQAKLLFKEGVFTLSDLDRLLLDLQSAKWVRLSECLDKRVVLACTTRAKVAAKSQ